MTTYDLWMTKFGDLPPLKQVAIMVGMAIAASDLLTVLFFLVVRLDRLDVALIVTTIIVIIVSVPLGAFLVGLNYRLKQTALRLDLALRKDDLTGLSNRNEFYMQAQKQIALCDREKSAGAVLYIDADHFKSINDRYGHAVGDGVLQEIGILIRSTIGEWDFAARFGGEEFAIFLTGADLGKADWISHRVLTGVRDISKYLGISDLDVTVSVGISIHRPGQDLEEALVAADKCLYAAKNQGRNRIVHADESPPTIFEPKLRKI
ncbi:GGDEF domain-containing protein [Phyllobacterium chamaecytisi]|uniref:GGDEF domain-containing protein n=1 Tax=Phyllobacterium chamaecytisi TaxID=2876082 RepID=UPI001CC8F72E|nr:GGDEF domain-containing protein [Phyllobacterium sp. KW56]MBZ9601702.1 GGDEF domain-containing protein [Phyllobacterium sp. KW56]